MKKFAIPLSYLFYFISYIILFNNVPIFYCFLFSAVADSVKFCRAISTVRLVKLHLLFFVFSYILFPSHFHPFSRCFLIVSLLVLFSFRCFLIQICSFALLSYSLPARPVPQLLSFSFPDFCKNLPFSISFTRSSF